jgi:serine/threonine-protein kinase
MSSDPPAKGQQRRIPRVGKYEVLAHVATGGMGAVYRGRDTETQKEVALKILSPESAAKPALLERFRREARNAQKLQHENIVAVYEFDEIKGTYFLVMEFVDGTDLHEYIERKGTLDPEESRQIMIQATRALAHAHKHEIVHRDIKPSNFLLGRKDKRLIVKLADLGLSREVTSDEFRVTRAGTTVGTVDYMSPEQARDSGQADIRSDIYSLGCTWFHMLTGQTPFPKGGLAERLIQHMENPPPDARKFNPRVSDDLVAVLDRTLEKDPRDRYQTPAELLDDLLSLQPYARASSQRDTTVDEEAPVSPSRSLRNRKGKRRRSSGEKTRPDRESAHSGRTLWMVVGGVALLLVGLGLGIWFIATRSGRPKTDNNTPIVEGPVSTDRTDRRVDSVKDKDKPKDKGPDSTRPVEPVKTGYPALYQPSQPIPVEALRQEIESPWGRDALKETPPLHVGRLRIGNDANWFPSLTEACAAVAPDDKVRVIEINDNGPLYENPAAIADRHLIIRAAKGYRPLIVWDAHRALDDRKRRPDDDRPLTFLDVKRGSLTLEGVEMVVRWTESFHVPMTLLQVADGDLTVRNCSFAMTGKHRGGVTLARFLGKAGRCRLSQCQARTTELIALALEAPGSDVLIENCLFVGGDPSLLQVRTDEKQPTMLRVVRSTLICWQNLLAVQTAAGSRAPALNWMGWDTLLSRSSEQAGGTLVTLPAGAGTDKMVWRSYNCLYCGWQKLLSGTPSVPASDLASWHRLWHRVEGDVARREPWPEKPISDPEDRNVRTFSTEKTRIAFRTSLGEKQLLGCDLAVLPPMRDNWNAVAFERATMQMPEPPADVRPPKPTASGELYVGEELDLSKIKDLGEYLNSKAPTLGKRVVLYLSGTGQHRMSPIRLRNTTLVLYFEPPKDATKDEPLSLSLPFVKDTSADEAMIQIDNGSLEIIGGDLWFDDDRSKAKVPHWMLQVTGGDLRLCHCRLRGPQQAVPDGFRGLISFHGSGDPAADRACTCVVNESVLLSSQLGLHIAGTGARVLVRQSVLLAGTQTMDLDLGPTYKGRAGVLCVWDHVTVGARQSAVHLERIASLETPEDPVLIVTRECAFVNPFVTKSTRMGMLTADATALDSGAMLWESQGDFYDQKLHFRAATTPPAQPQTNGADAWLRLLGSNGITKPVLGSTLQRTFVSDKWFEQLELLAIPNRPASGDRRPGADLKTLGAGRRHVPRG